MSNMEKGVKLRRLRNILECMIVIDVPILTIPIWETDSKFMIVYVQTIHGLNACVCDHRQLWVMAYDVKKGDGK